ncbi:MAG: bactofilin family protein [Saprospiraceae bacterium]|jgi:cytoskeletal protein CcmA (bactofilin family)
MFGSSNKKETGKGGNPSGNLTTVNAFNTLVTGTVVEGTVKSEKDIRIEGSVKGTLHCDAKLVIGPTGYIEGDVRCASAVIEGRFEGSIFIADLLNVRESATVSGEVTTGRLVVQSGANFNVQCNMAGGAGTSAASKISVTDDGGEKRGTGSGKQG